jgi:hypothetical protein
MPTYETPTPYEFTDTSAATPQERHDRCFGMTPDEKERLEAIKAKAVDRHERARKAAAARGRKDFPACPFECSWAYWLQFLRGLRPT